MRKELFEIGKTVDSAIDAACEKLGCSREDCEWEIIDLPRKGFLGLKNTPAKVRVSIGAPDEEPVRPPVQEPQKQQEKPKKPEQKPEQKIEQKPEQKPEQKSAEHPRKEQQKAESVDAGEITEKEKLARDYLAEIIEASGLKAEYAITREHGGSCINIVGSGLGVIIGRRGETLDAIQYLAGLVANRGDGDYLRLTVDCGGYRLKRKDTLEQLAKKLAHQVLKTNVSKVLEPMNPFERRIIHATVSEIEGVSSSSVGEEPNRRVVITSPSAKPAPRGGYRSDRPSGDGYNKNRGPRRDFKSGGEGGDRPSRTPREGGERGGFRRDGRGDDRRGGNRKPPASPAVTQGPPKQTPETEATSGISFGKIDLE